MTRDVVSSGPTPSDGRLARGQRTRMKVAEAVISLVEAGDPQPTAKEIAEQAHISVRLVFHHFEDMDALYRAVVELQASRHWSHLHEVRHRPPARRADRTHVRQRSRLYDAIGPVRRAISPQALRSDEISTMLANSNVFLRHLLVCTFDPELEGAGDGRRELLDALDLADVVGGLGPPATDPAPVRGRRPADRHPRPRPPARHRHIGRPVRGAPVRVLPVNDRVPVKVPR